MKALSKARQCVVLGGGGHARVVVEALRASKRAKAVGVLDEDPRLKNSLVGGLRVLGGDQQLAAVARRVKFFVMGVGGVRDNRPRRALFEKASAAGLRPLSVVHPSAVCSAGASIGEGSVVLPGAIVNSGAVLGRNVIVNSGAVIEHDCRIADHAHVATGARLSGGVVVGEGAHIGAGASVRQGLTVGAWSVVGLGAAVIRDVSPASIVVGVPAKARTKAAV